MFAGEKGWGHSAKAKKRRAKLNEKKMNDAIIAMEEEQERIEIERLEAELAEEQKESDKDS